jgi:hypothetical protein
MFFILLTSPKALEDRITAINGKVFCMESELDIHRRLLFFLFPFSAYTGYGLSVLTRDLNELYESALWR